MRIIEIKKCSCCPYCRKISGKLSRKFKGRKKKYEYFYCRLLSVIGTSRLYGKRVSPNKIDKKCPLTKRPACELLKTKETQMGDDGLAITKELMDIREYIKNKNSNVIPITHKALKAIMHGVEVACIDKYHVMIGTTSVSEEICEFLGLDK